MDLCEEEIRINREGYVLKSLMAYVNGLLPALLILALSSKTSGNLICHDLINFVTEGQYLYIRLGIPSNRCLFLNIYSSHLNHSLTNTSAVNYYFNFTNAKRSFTLPKKKIAARFAFCNPQ